MAVDARKRLFTLSGVIPAAAFLIEHLVVTGSAMGGAARFDRVMGALARSSVLSVFEVLFVYVPLAYHALYGLHLTFKTDKAHTYASDSLYKLQKISGAVVLAFIVLHFQQIRLQRWLGNISTTDLYTRLVDKMSATNAGIPWFAVIMLVGVTATVFHLVNGLWSFRAQTARPDRTQSRNFVIFGVVLLLIGGGTVVSVATGSRFLPAPEPEMPPCGENASSPAAPSSQEAGKTP